ncbi:NYN domain-containing protein [Leifsonia sp. AG29]|uniref:NYN domain-containing protein n=1 Tax=Leifsonia sp. AG29 TaxID=2598860 RepID=UPI00131E08F6|nr:NYN domain-containing protein [Leifsonia sp. AG29]
MSEPGDGRVAVYIDFDNIVISRYDQVHGRGSYMRDRPKSSSAAPKGAFADKLEEARVDLGAILDFDSSFGTLVLTRAYADWSSAVNAEYRGQLVGRAVDLVQLFPAAAYAKNGADIRLAVDAVEDLFRLPELTHVVIVAGDSDYVPLAQRIRRLGRYVVGIGVAGSTAKSLAAACDEFVSYDDLPGVARDEAADAAIAPEVEVEEAAEAAEADETAAAAVAEPAAPTVPAAKDGAAPAEKPATSARRRSSRKPKEAAEPAAVVEASDETLDERQQTATRLLARAMQLGHEKDDSDWLNSGTVKSQMKRMDPSFSEKALGYRSFSDFVKSRADLVELDDSTTAQLVRLAPTRPRRARHSGRATDPVNS